MAYPPLFVGETHIKPQWTVTDENGNPVSLQGATATVEWQPAQGTAFPGGGSAVVSTVSPYNVLTYTLAATDTQTPGAYKVQPTVTYANSTVLRSIQPVTIVVAQLAPL